jgi:DNA repair exonuclease SbcCD nuclease subunit
MKIENRYIGCFSDIHLGLGQDSKNWHNTALNFAKWASDYYREALIKDIIIPGDIFHNRSEVSVETLSIAKEFFDYFHDFEIYISTGNHDCYKKESSDVNSIKIFDGWKNIHIVDKTAEVIETIYPDKTLSLVPWGTTIEQMPKASIMFCHLEIASFYMNSYKMCEHGFSYKDLFNKAEYIISGHFHKKDHRKFEKGQIVYLGSPYEQNFGDFGDQRGIYIFDIKTNDIKFIENKISPKHIKLKLNEELINNGIDSKYVSNNIISLTLSDKDDQKDILNVQAKLALLNPVSIRLDYETTENEIVIDENIEYDSGDLLKSIDEYINTLDIEYKKEVVEYVKNLYNSLI